MKLFSRKFFVTVFAASFIFVLARAPIAHALDCTKNVCLINPLENTISPDAPVQSLAALFINTIFGISGSIALAMYVWGGTKFLISRGDQKMVTEGKNILIWTSAGVLMLFASYTLVNFLFTSLSNPSSLGVGGSGGPSAPTLKSCCIDLGASPKKTTTIQGGAQVSHPDCVVSDTIILIDGACDVPQEVNNCAQCVPGGTVSGDNGGKGCVSFTSVAACVPTIQ